MLRCEVLTAESLHQLVRSYLAGQLHAALVERCLARVDIVEREGRAVVRKDNVGIGVKELCHLGLSISVPAAVRRMTYHPCGLLSVHPAVHPIPLVLEAERVVRQRPLDGAAVHCRFGSNRVGAAALGAGDAAHIIIQVALHQGRKVVVAEQCSHQAAWPDMVMVARAMSRGIPSARYRFLTVRAAARDAMIGVRGTFVMH